jgi:hypothetical protein
LISTLIFSKDRAAQLDLLLGSIERYAPHLDYRVLVAASNEDFDQAYSLLNREYPLSDEFHFESDVRGWIERADETICFLVDDDVFFRKAPSGITPMATPFCYRLNGHGCWNWRNADPATDRGYPLNLDGTVYMKETLAEALDDFHFADPTQLEAGLADRARTMFAPEWLHASEQSLVGIPANRVSASSNNTIMGGDEHSAQALNERFLNGQRLDLDAMNFAHVVSAHAYVPYVWKEVNE